MDFITKFALVGAAVSFTAWAVLANRRRIARVSEFVSRIPRSSLSMFLAFALVATLCAQKQGGTNELLRTTEHTEYTKRADGEVAMRSGSNSVCSVYSVVDQYRLESVVTNDTYSYAMPTNGTRYARWWKRGAYEDVFSLDLDGMRFPLGTNLCSSLWVYTWGMAGVRLGDASNRIAVTGVPMSAVPFASQFWSAALPDGAHRLTWQDFALDRDTNTPVSAQLDLYPSGDFVARSNLVESVYRRINPDDADDDGIPDDEDQNPFAYDGDNFGPHQELHAGANSNAYCWVDVVVQDANALVTFSGDGHSSLPDPRFVAKAGVTNRVTILIGKTYHVNCQMPIACVEASDPAVNVDQVAVNELSICWPVEIDCIGMRSGLSFSMNVWPDWLGGGFVWTNSCCSVSGEGWTFTYSCGGTCTCTGCGALGYYGYEGYRLPAGGGPCGCSSESSGDDGGEEEDDGPYDAGASAVFSMSAVIFEDAYTNSPGDSVARQSTQTELNCVAHGGPNGGHVRFAIVGEDKLERVSGHVLPVEQDVGPGKKIDFTIVYKGKLPSSAAEDIVVTTAFTENVAGATPSSSQAKLTSVKVELSSLNVSLEEYPNRHIRGIGEKVSCEWTPSVSGLSFQTQNGTVCFASYSNRRDLTCPFLSASGICSISMGGATCTPAVQVLEPTGIEARNAYRLSYSVPTNSPGGVGFAMDLYIMPDTVSFQSLEFWERPALDSTIEGYFTNASFQAVWHHDTSMGAGVWHGVSSLNYWFADTAQMGDELILPASPGILVWHIPIDWRKKDDPAFVHQDFKSVDQTFEMSATGRLTVYKYQHWAAREMSGATYKSEGMQ